MEKEGSKVNGKVALMTSAGGGIGRQFSGAMGSAGESIIIADVNAEAVNAAA